MILIFRFWGCEDKYELPYKNLRSINIAYNPLDSDFVNEDSYYISSKDSLGNFLTNQLLKKVFEMLTTGELINSE